MPGSFCQSFHHIHVCICLYTCLCMYMHVCIYIYIYIYIYIWKSWLGVLHWWTGHNISLAWFFDYARDERRAGMCSFSFRALGERHCCWCQIHSGAWGKGLSYYVQFPAKPNDMFAFLKQWTQTYAETYIVVVSSIFMFMPRFDLFMSPFMRSLARS